MGTIRYPMCLIVGEGGGHGWRQPFHRRRAREVFCDFCSFALHQNGLRSGGEPFTLIYMANKVSHTARVGKIKVREKDVIIKSIKYFET